MGAINSKQFAVYDTFRGLFQKEEEFSLIVKSEERRAVHLSLKWVHLQEETKQPLCKNNVLFTIHFLDTLVLISKRMKIKITKIIGLCQQFQGLFLFTRLEIRRIDIINSFKYIILLQKNLGQYCVTRQPHPTLLSYFLSPN